MSARPAHRAADEPGRLYSIGDLSAEFALSHRAIRFYEDRGLLSPQRIGGNRIRGDYGGCNGGSRKLAGSRIRQV